MMLPPSPTPSDKPLAEIVELAMLGQLNDLDLMLFCMELRETLDTVIAEIKRRERAESNNDSARCSGCGTRWSSPEGFITPGVVHLCGDCWRKAQPVLHSERVPARRKAESE